ncbi:MAG: DUF624 domain-containing protein [Anaerolineae bacterium]|nr:DUF624 domain-containing protein [Anaerolineae bacterium]
MVEFLRVLWGAVKDFWEELLLLVLMNLLTVLFAFPVVTFPPALAGLWNVGNLVAKGKGIHWSDYFDGFRHYFWKSLKLALLNVLVLVIVYTNIRFYTPEVAPFKISREVSAWISVFFTLTGLIWLMIQMYPMALLLEQEDERVRIALRNAAFLTGLKPGFTLLLFVTLVLIGIVSLLLPILWPLVTLSFYAVLCNKAVLHLLEPYRKMARERKEAAERAIDSQSE